MTDPADDRRLLVEIEVDGEIADYEANAPYSSPVSDRERDEEIERRLLGDAE